MSEKEQPATGVKGRPSRKNVEENEGLTGHHRLPRLPHFHTLARACSSSSFHSAVQRPNSGSRCLPIIAVFGPRWPFLDLGAFGFQAAGSHPLTSCWSSAPLLLPSPSKPLPPARTGPLATTGLLLPSVGLLPAPAHAFFDFLRWTPPPASHPPVPPSGKQPNPLSTSRPHGPWMLPVSIPVSILQSRMDACSSSLCLPQRGPRNPCREMRALHSAGGRADLSLSALP